MSVLRRSLPVLALVVLLALGGCAAPFSDGDADPAAITDKVDQRLESIDTMEATMSWEISAGNSSDSFTARVAYADPGKVNLTYRDPEPLAGARIVNDGQSIVAVNPRAGTYARSSVTGPGASLSRVFLNAAGIRNATFEGNETIDGEGASKISYAVDGEEVSLFLQGSGDASRLSEGTDDDANVTLWVDREKWVPVKATIAYTSFDPTVTITLTYDDITLNESLPEDRFETEVGDAVQVGSVFEVLSTKNVTSYPAYEDARAAAGEAMPPEQLPGGFAFREGFSVDYGDDARYRLFYTNGTRNREVHMMTSPITLLADAETATVDGRTVNVSEAGRATILEYDCPGRTYAIIGTGGREPLFEVVEAIGCPDSE